MASLKKRGKKYILQYYVAGKQRRISLGTTSLQIAKEKKRQFESAQFQGDDTPLPTKTPLDKMLNEYVRHMETIKTLKSAQTDVYYLRAMFGDDAEALKITARRRPPRKKPELKQDRRVKSKVIEARYLEDITTAQISEFIASHVRSRGLAAKTANRYREIMHRLFSWAMRERGVKMPGRINPAAEVERYREKASEIRFLTLEQIDQQLKALTDHPQMRAMVAMLIYAGLRREELIWLRHEDIDLKSGPYGMLRIRAKTINGQFWQPKTKKNRAVPISSSLRAILDEYTSRPNTGRWFAPSPMQSRLKLFLRAIVYQNPAHTQRALEIRRCFLISLMGNTVVPTQSFSFFPTPNFSLNKRIFGKRVNFRVKNGLLSDLPPVLRKA